LSPTLTIRWVLTLSEARQNLDGKEEREKNRADIWRAWEKERENKVRTIEKNKESEKERNKRRDYLIEGKRHSPTFPSMTGGVVR
jgi:hypothetical protein